ncbi:hypothetical protein F3Y22_tig00116997pilonHSYRG00282 [Hibiscus syriacus]|uniref:Uncharacterized protein n=1 Tax=Hibiscus syriacus TaxID=106335 RepID=A0A6A2XS72_HIBSY|nr:cyclin-dependent protein kinase inhibitor SMR2-like [Hibiscus syriacus]KAE8656754.1 hypothetical protein F3Y22_tig00116997pilonHSYRG00282 [Hibiscus syriacus]
MSKDHRGNILQETLQKHDNQQRQEEGGIENDGVKEEECKTPTSSDQKIASIQSCPPTPKKKVRAKFGLKRKLSELHFFETTRREELESFFRSNSDPFTFGGSLKFKRRCRSA